MFSFLLYLFCDSCTFGACINCACLLSVRTALYGYTVCLSTHRLMSIGIILRLGLITKAGVNTCVYLCTYTYFPLGVLASHGEYSSSSVAKFPVLGNHCP